MYLTAATHPGRLARTSGVRPALVALALFGLAAPSLAADKSWNTGDGDWGVPGNWTPNGVPGHDDHIRIGNLPGVQDSTVILTQSQGYDFLQITSGMTLDMNNFEFVSFDDAWILGEGSRLIARPAAGPNQQDFQGNLHIGPGAHFEMADNVPVRIFESESSGTISGRGECVISSYQPFDNSGVIRPSNNGGLIMQQGHFGDQIIDLDGSSGTGHLLLDTPFAALTIIADSLSDSFSGTITMTRGAGLAMDLAQGWTADAGCVIDIEGTNDPNAASQIHGSAFVFDGTLNVNSFQAHLRILSDVTIGANADVTVAYTDWLELDGTTTVAGGQFLLGHSGILDFDGQTIMQSGTFNTNLANGSVDLNGPTTWNGGCDINGRARQFGNAFVAGPSVINATVFDMDGDGDTVWTVWNDLVINADSVQSNNPQDFHGTITVASTSGRLTMNLQDQLFSMAGEMNLFAHPAVFGTRYAGDDLDLLGDLSASGKVVMEAFLRAADGTIDIGDESAVLRLDAGGLITDACAFSGDGELRIGFGSAPLFTDADLGSVGLMNQGTLEIQSLASVDRFENAPASLWDVSLEGTDPGVDYDQLVVANEATVRGNLGVTLHNGFMPAGTDSFTVLTATTLVAAFDNALDGDRIVTTGGEGSFVVTYDYATGTVVLSRFMLTPDCPADLDHDGVVDFNDLLLLLAAWGTPDGDIDGDSDTDFNDLLALLAAWGACP